MGWDLYGYSSLHMDSLHSNQAKLKWRYWARATKAHVMWVNHMEASMQEMC